jgi:hypothetical protein
MVCHATLWVVTERVLGRANTGRNVDSDPP